MDEEKIEVLPNHKEISELANALYRKQDEFDLSNPYEVGYVLINKLGYRKESDTAKEICEKVIALYRQVMPLQKKGLFIAENAFICGVREIEKYFAEDKE